MGISLLFTVFIIFFKSKNIDLENSKNLDNFSSDELIEFSNSGDKFPDNFIDNKLNDYKRIINSSNSIEEAQNAVLEEFNSNNKVIKNNLLVESDTYYYIERVYGDWGINDVLHFKKDVIEIDKETGKINSTDSIEIKEIEIPGTSPFLDW